MNPILRPSIRSNLKEAEIHVYRIVQEAPSPTRSNIPPPREAVVGQETVGGRPGFPRHGRGFDSAKSSPQPRDLGYGLIGITERVSILAGI